MPRSDNLESSKPPQSYVITFFLAELELGLDRLSSQVATTANLNQIEVTYPTDGVSQLGDNERNVAPAKRCVDFLDRFNILLLVHYNNLNLSRAVPWSGDFSGKERIPALFRGDFPVRGRRNIRAQKSGLQMVMPSCRWESLDAGSAPPAKVPAHDGSSSGSFVTRRSFRTSSFTILHWRPSSDELAQNPHLSAKTYG